MEKIERLKKIIKEQFIAGEDEITLETNFKKDLHMDSLDCVELVMAVEDEFDISIKDEEAESIVTVKEALALIVSKD